MKIKKGKRYQVLLREYARKGGNPAYGKTSSKVVGWQIAEKIKNIINSVSHFLNKNKFE